MQNKLLILTGFLLYKSIPTGKIMENVKNPAYVKLPTTIYFYYICM